MSEILIDKSAYFHNLSQISQKVAKERIMLVLKDNAYGHGMREIAGLAREFGIKRAVTRTLDEAREISEFFEQILILSHIPNGNENPNFIYAVNDMSYFARLKTGTNIHIVADTNMHRNGICAYDLDEALALCKKHSLALRGFFTHYRASDELSSDFYAQRQNFAEFKKIAKFKANEAGFNELIFHSSNSAAIERRAGFDDEFVRVGMAQYGYAQFDESLNLRPVLSLWADLISQRVLKKGERVGYGGVFCAPCDMKIGTYDLGYADGLLRYAGLGDLRLGSGERLLGKMSMDSFCAEFGGERVCVINDAREWARFFGTIEYDVLVKLHEKISRRVV
ncbi:alanine racemase [Campylobacter sp. VBCF_04 NA7]|uniref:alanine racemase n=1 Tax=Campylobacter sp. VBCF_04 NA7 TaxID=2983830 RepID=UPI0022E9E108|nr:alanine racemase [Campylobacter sp. VBCF_04 NA7]MDA3057876.1 alanine racemase [Campylobacter sp. VBCF_04 NA7]